MDKQKITDYIYDRLKYIYCNNCRYNKEVDNEVCEDCHRKYMGWEISRETAEQMAEKIMEL